MAHQVTFDALEKWAAASWYIFACSIVDAENKALCMNMRGRYRVQDHRETVYEGDNPIEAVSIYNAI